MWGMDPLEELIQASIDDWRAAVGSGDQAEALRLRQDVAALCAPAVRKAAASFAVSNRVFDHEDVESVAQLVFFDVLASHMSTFDADKAATLSNGQRGTFAGWVLHGCKTWRTELRREITEATGTNGIGKTDDQMRRIWHGCRERFISSHGRDWTRDEVGPAIWEYQMAQKTARYTKEHPEWTAEQVEQASRDRIKRDGHVRALREIDEIMRIDRAAQVAYLDQPMGPEGAGTLADLIAGEFAVTEEPDDAADDLTRIATLGMGLREAKKVAAYLDDNSKKTDSDLVAVATRNMANPVAHFVVLTDIGDQFETSRAPGETLAVRESLLAAAALQ